MKVLCFSGPFANFAKTVKFGLNLEWHFCRDNIVFKAPDNETGCCFKFIDKI